MTNKNQIDSLRYLSPLEWLNLWVLVAIVHVDRDSDRRGDRATCHTESCDLKADDCTVLSFCGELFKEIYREIIIVCFCLNSFPDFI